jgi:hypothetical protein
VARHGGVLQLGTGDIRRHATGHRSFVFVDTSTECGAGSINSTGNGVG